MSRTIWLSAVLVCSVLSMMLPAQARRTCPTASDLIPYLQAEVNEVAMLQAQANCLQQQGDPLGAALVASYIPDHQMQVSLLSAQIQSLGGNPANVVPNQSPVLGTRQQVLAYDMKAHAQAIKNYRSLANNTASQSTQNIALMGQNGASRHYLSLLTADASTSSSQRDQINGLLAALTLEREAIDSAQAQAALLNSQGNSATANLLLSSVPQHQAQVARLDSLIRQMGGNVNRACNLPTVAVGTCDQFIAMQRVFNTQLINTYAIDIASLPANSQIRQVAQQGQNIALVALGQLQGQQPAVAAIPGTTSSVIIPAATTSAVAIPTVSVVGTTTSTATSCP